MQKFKVFNALKGDVNVNKGASTSIQTNKKNKKLVSVTAYQESKWMNEWLQDRVHFLSPSKFSLI